MDRRLRNRILIFLVVAGLIAYGLVRITERSPAPKISVVSPVRQNLSSSISSNGKVEPVSPSVLRAQLDTFVEKVGVTEGQSVGKGQLLLELNVKDAEAQLADTRSKLLKAQDALRVANRGGSVDEAARLSTAVATAVADRDSLQRQHDALQRLLAKQAATKDELAANELKLEKAQAEVTRSQIAKQEFERNAHLNGEESALQVKQLQGEVAVLEDKVREGHITAPSDGTLYSLPVKAGDYVKVGDLLAEMANLHEVRVRAFIDEPDLGVLEPGESVKITWDALPGRSWTGKTSVIPKQVVARGARNVGELLCDVGNEKLELLPNTNVNVRINSKERKNVLTIPRGTVEGSADHRYVYVATSNGFGGKAVLERREIHVGIADPTNYEITSGLEEHDLVALPSDTEFHDGMAVKIVNTEKTNIGETHADN